MQHRQDFAVCVMTLAQLKWIEMHLKNAYYIIDSLTVDTINLKT